MKILLWSIIHDKLNTMDMLKKKGLMVLDKCLFCGENVESYIHLFCDCDVAFYMWSRCLVNLHIDLDCKEHIRDQFYFWDKLIEELPNDDSKYKFTLAYFIFCWILWNKRNKRCFNGIANSSNNIPFQVLKFVYIWAGFEKRKAVDCIEDLVTSRASKRRKDV